MRAQREHTCENGGFGARGRPVTIREIFLAFVVIGEEFYGARELRKRRR